MRKVAELVGAELDYWVAKAEGRLCRIEEVLSSDYRMKRKVCCVAPFGSTPETARRFRDFNEMWEPSRDWDQGGPIIDRERIAIVPGSDAQPFHPCWTAVFQNRETGDCSEPEFISFESALVAAMRAYVASKFGDEVPPIASLPG